jgi:ABC-type phosphate/phosphonate transport system substrate-binding protein
VLVAAVAGQAPRADAQAGAKLKIGLPKGTFRDVPTEMLHSAAAPFRELFKRQASVDGDVELVADHDALADRMKQNKIDLGVFTGFEYAWVKASHPQIVPLVVVIPHGGKLQAVLVVPKDSKAQKPADLAGACVSIPPGSKPHCHLFIERLRDGLPDDCCGQAKCEAKGPDDVLDGVSTGKLQAGLVDISALAAYQKNRPGAAGQVRVLAQSEMFPPGVIAYQKGALDQGTVNRIVAGLTKTGGTPQGRAFLMLAKLKGFEEAPAGFDADLKRINAAYPPPAPPK